MDINSAIKAALANKLAAEEGELRRLLPQWRPEWGEPTAIIDHEGCFIGLGPQSPIGAIAAIYLPMRTRYIIGMKLDWSTLC